MSLKERPEEGRGQRQAGRQAGAHTHTHDRQWVPPPGPVNPGQQVTTMTGHTRTHARAHTHMTDSGRHHPGQ